MQKVIVAIVLTLVASMFLPHTIRGRTIAAAGEGTLVDFEHIGADVDDAPAGFTAAVTGGGDPQGWKIDTGEGPGDGTGGQKQLVRRSSDRSEKRAPHCVYDDISARDVDVTVFIKITSGTFEQSAGLVARYQDEKNYYCLRANAKEGNVALFKVVDGAFESLKDRSTAVTLKKWQKLRLVVKGESFEAFLDDVSLFTAKDAAIDVAGKVGLWTRSDSEARFDDLRIIKND